MGNGKGLAANTCTVRRKMRWDPAISQTQCIGKLGVMKGEPILFNQQSRKLGRGTLLLTALDSSIYVK